MSDQFHRATQEKSPPSLRDVFSLSKIKVKASKPLSIMGRDPKGLQFVEDKLNDKTIEKQFEKRTFTSLQAQKERSGSQSNHQPDKSQSIPPSHRGLNNNQYNGYSGAQSNHSQSKNDKKPFKSPHVPSNSLVNKSHDEAELGSQQEKKVQNMPLKQQIPLPNTTNQVISKAYDDEKGWMPSKNFTQPGNIPIKIPRVQILQGNNTKVNNKRKHDNTLVLTEKKKEPIKKKIKEIIEVDLVSSSDDEVEEVVYKPVEAEATQASSSSIDADCNAIASQEKKLKFGYGTVGRMPVLRLWVGTRISDFKGPYDIEIDIHLQAILIYRRNETIVSHLTHETLPFHFINNIYYGVRDQGSCTGYLALEPSDDWKPENSRNIPGGTYDTRAAMNTLEHPCKYLLLILTLTDVTSCVDICRQVSDLRTKLNEVERGVETYVYADIREEKAKEIVKPTRITSELSPSNVVSNRRSRRSTVVIDKSSEIGMSEEDKKVFVCYPVDEEAQDVVTIHNGDIRRLHPGELLNDTLVDFGIRYMLAGIDPLQRAKIHVFTCYFYTKLLEGRSPQDQHALVSRWTKNVDLFDMDYIIVPVNLTGHWSLFVIVKPGLVTHLPSDINVRTLVNQSKKNSNDSISSQASSDTTSAYPYIMFMDSLQLHAAATITRNLRNYLMEEWKARKSATAKIKELNINANNCITLRINVPRQRNGTDCGVYVVENARRVVQQQPQCSLEDIISIEKEVFSKEFNEADANCERIRLSSYLQELKPEYDAVRAVQQQKEQEEKIKKNQLKRQQKAENAAENAVESVAESAESTESVGIVVMTQLEQENSAETGL